MAEKPTKRQQRVERNRKRLLGAAMNVFSRKGYHKATLDEICKRANLAKGTIYQHFSSKKGLFLELVDSRFRELGESTAEAVSEVEHPLAGVQAAISAYVRFFGDNRSFYRLLIHEESSFVSEIRDRLHKRFFSHLQILEAVLRKGMKSGEVKKMDPRSAAFGLIGMCNSVIFRWLMSEHAYPLEKEVPLVSEIFLRGVSRQT